MHDRRTRVTRKAPPTTSTGLEGEFARGRRAETPFLLVGGTAAVIGVVVLVLASALLLVWWLA
jgi:hypothetical protein